MTLEEAALKLEGKATVSLQRAEKLRQLAKLVGDLQVTSVVDIGLENATTDVYLVGGKEVAHDLAEKLDIRLDRIFNEHSGYFKYMASKVLEVLDLYIYSDNEGCELVPHKKRVTQTTYEVKC